jgi:hypothetical protein
MEEWERNKQKVENLVSKSLIWDDWDGGCPLDRITMIRTKGWRRDEKDLPVENGRNIRSDVDIVSENAISPMSKQIRDEGYEERSDEIGRKEQEGTYW